MESDHTKAGKGGGKRGGGKRGEERGGGEEGCNCRGMQLAE